MLSGCGEPLSRPVFVVEDDPLAAALVCGLLKQRFRIECDVAYGDKDARRLLRQAAGGQGGELPAMVILDAHLRDGSGLDLATWITMSGAMQGVKVFITSADDKGRARQNAIDAGAHDFAGKGELANKLAGWIKQALPNQAA